jgi:protein-disulfide isomerase
MGLVDRRALIASGLAASVAGPALAAKPKAVPHKAAPKTVPAGPPKALPDDMAIGSPKAGLTVIEYFSASCPHCAAFNNEVFPDIRKTFIDTGKVRWVFREMLTPPVEIAAAGFLLARAAGPAKYYPFLDALFHRQADIYGEGTGAAARRILLEVCGQYGIDEARFNASLSDKRALDALNGRAAAAAKAGVTSVPTMLIGDRRLVGEIEVRTAPEVLQQVLSKRRHG